MLSRVSACNPRASAAPGTQGRWESGYHALGHTSCDVLFAGFVVDCEGDDSDDVATALLQAQDGTAWVADWAADDDELHVVVASADEDRAVAAQSLLQRAGVAPDRVQPFGALRHRQG